MEKRNENPTPGSSAPASASTALLVMDVQDSIVNRFGEKKEAVTAPIILAIAAARKAALPIIYVVVGFRKGFPEVSPENKSFTAMRTGGGLLAALEEPIAIFAAVAPQPGDTVVTKRRVSAFTGSDLEVVLRSMAIRHLVLTGFSTSGVVLSTVREAADKDFRLTVLSDGCADMDPEVHNVLLTKVFPRQADVLTVQDWAAGLGA